MASLIVDLFVGVLQLAFWVIWDLLPILCFLTAFATVFAATLGRVSVEFPAKLARIGWTGTPRVTRSPQGRAILSPALGVIIGFIVWAVIVSAVVAYRA